MRSRLRFPILITNILVLFLLVNLFTVLPSYARKFTQVYRQFIPTTLYNNVLLPKPSWWTGANGSLCDDTNHYNNTTPQTHAFELSSLAVYRGMYACGPATPNYSVYLPKGDPHPVEVREFQCTELAMRYLLTAFGTHPYVADGGGVVWNYKGALFQQITNLAGSGNAPQQGDIMSYGSKTSGGHVSIVQDAEVNSSGDGYVDVIDENGFSGGLGLHNITNWFVDGTNDGGVITGWLHPNTVVQSPNAGSNSNSLVGVATVAADDVWAVGYSQSTPGGVNQTLIEHWDGSNWTVISSPNMGTGDNYLNGVAALPNNDVWAVGSYVDSNRINQTLFEYYDSKLKTWTASTQGPGILNAITRVPNTTEAWAVGNDDNSLHPVISHLVNSNWTTVTDATKTMLLDAVSAHGSHDVWAVGETAPGPSKTATLHWNGSKWTTETSPSPGSSYNHLYGVTAITSDDVWAVGVSGSPSGGTAFIMQGTGSGKTFAWGTPILLNIGTNSVLNAVKALSSTNIWAVGTYNNPDQNTLVYHYDGSGWSQINGSSTSGALDGITINPGNGNVWTVGGGQGAKTLTEFFN